MNLRKLFNKLPKTLDIESISYDCDPNDFEVVISYNVIDDLKAILTCHLYFDAGKDTLHDYSFDVDHYDDNSLGEYTHEIYSQDLNMINKILKSLISEV